MPSLLAATSQQIIPLVVISIYLAVVLYIGIFAFRRGKSTGEDFFMASRSIGSIVFFLSLFATNMTAVAILGSSGFAYKRGIGVFGLMASASCFVIPITLFVIGTRLWALGKRFGHMTQVSFFRDRWECSTIGTVLFTMTAAMLLPYLIVSIVGGGTILEAWELGSDGPIARALRESEERYRFLAETVPVQIWTARPDGLLDYVTEQTARHFGLTAERLLAEGWQNVVHPADLAHAVERWTHALTTGSTYEVEFRLRLADGTYAYHLARAVPQRNTNGDVVRWFGTNTNIDEQREEQRRTRALLDEVALQARESESVLVTLRRQKADAEARIAELEQRIARGRDAQ